MTSKDDDERATEIVRAIEIAAAFAAAIPGGSILATLIQQGPAVQQLSLDPPMVWV